MLNIRHSGSDMEIHFSIQKVVGKVLLGRSGLGFRHINPEPERGSKEHREFYMDMSHSKCTSEVCASLINDLTNSAESFNFLLSV